MFPKEHSYARARRHSAQESRLLIQLDAQRQWRTDKPSDAEGVDLAGRCVYAQNDAYLELCNPGWDMQWRAGIGNFFVVLPALFIIWGWYAFAVHPLLFGRVLMFFRPSEHLVDSGDLWFGWLLVFPLALGSVFILYLWFYVTGLRTAWFTYARGRVRFNRRTRKVYVLRPGYCGGNAVFEWGRLRALFDPEGPHPWGEQKVKSLALYHPSLDGNDPQTKGEDCIFVGPSLHIARVATAANLWEYIRRYMEEGPSVDVIPPNAPGNYKKIPRYLPADYTTYCGKPSGPQYTLEQRPGFMETLFHMMSQMTCSWPRFPKEWQSDSGLGEPEDRPVQTGAVMTAPVYRAEGKLSPEDDVEFLTHWGTEEALAEAKARVARLAAERAANRPVR